nr:MAG TPA: Rifin [Caudoviricetes sp.]
MVFIPVNLLIIFVEYILVRYKRITPTITTAT